MDKQKLTIIMSGGGMRNAFTTGALLGMQICSSKIDSIYCCSSSILNAVTIASGQIEESVSLWTEVMTSEEVFSWSKILQGKRPADLSAVAEKTLQMLDLDAFEASEINVFALLLNLTTGKTECLKVTKENIRKVIQTTSSLPLVSSPVLFPNGDYYSDGAMEYNVPFEFAVQDGKNNLLTILNQQKDEIPENASWLRRLISYPTFPKARDAYRKRQALHVRAIRQIHICDGKDGFRSTILYAGQKNPAKRMTRDIEKVQESIARGFDLGSRYKKHVLQYHLGDV